MKAKILGVLMLAALPILAFASVANAQTFRSGETTNVATNESVDGSAFITGSVIDVAGKINGDLYCAGQNITISGDIDGDVICAGQTVTVSGTVTGDVRVAGQTVAIRGDIKGSLSAAGQTVTLEGAGKIGRDAALVGQSVIVNSPIGRDAIIASDRSSLTATVGRNVTADAENLTLGKGATVAGYLNYTSPNMLTKDADAKVAGKISYTERKAEDRHERSYDAGGAILWGLMLLVSALIFALLFPRELHRTTESTTRSASRTFTALAVGLVAGIIMPVVIVLLMITVLGIPFGLVILTAWILILAVSGVFSAYFVGRVIWRTQTNAIIVTLVGALVIVVGLAIPILNIFVWLLTVWYGTGVILLQLKKLAVSPRYTIPSSKAHGRA